MYHAGIFWKNILCCDSKYLRNTYYKCNLFETAIGVYMYA